MAIVLFFKNDLMDTQLENLENINTNETFLGVTLVDERGGAMHKLLSDQETGEKHRNEESRGGKRRLLGYLRQGGARLLTGVPPGMEGWAEGSTDVGQGC